MPLTVIMAAPPLKEYLKGKAARNKSSDIAMFLRNLALKHKETNVKAIIRTLRYMKQKAKYIYNMEIRLQRKLWTSFYNILPSLSMDPITVEKLEKVLSNTSKNIKLICVRGGRRKTTTI